jgi:hypothetical protein
LPLEAPVAVDGKATVGIFDPNYFVAFTFVKDHAVSLEGAPPGCTAIYQPPHELDDDTMNALAAIPPERHDLLKVAVRLANLIKIDCGASAPAAAQAVAAPPTARAAVLDFPHGTLTPSDLQVVRQFEI